MRNGNGTGKTVETLSGEVEATNPKGIRIDGQWLNYSRYAEVPRPDVGSRVRVQLSNGWIKALELLDESASRERQEANAGVDRQQIILRLACLKAASEFAGKVAAGQLVRGHEPIKSAEVLVIAELWEQWVVR